METCPAEILLIRPPALAHERAYAAPPSQSGTPEARSGPEGRPTSEIVQIGTAGPRDNG